MSDPSIAKALSLHRGALLLRLLLPAPRAVGWIVAA